MLVREIVLETQQLDEASLRQMIAGAALALGLGVSGNASAEQLFVYLNPETGKLRAVTDMSRVPSNATMSFKVDTDAKTVTMIKGADAAVSPEIAKSVVQSAPRSAPVAVQEPKRVEPAKVNAPAKANAPDELDQVKKNAGIPNSEKITIKGLQFGMSLADVVSITGASENDWTKPFDFKNKETPKKKASSWMTALGNNFTIAGISGWSANLMSDNSLEGLQSLTTFPPSENVEMALDTFTKQFGQPKITKYKAKTKGGLDLNVFNAEWRIKDAIITMTNHIDRDKGIITIESKDNFEKSAQKNKDQSEKRSKDF